MSNELVRRGQRALVDTDSSLTRETGKTLAVGGAGTLGVMFLASIVPFVGTFGMAIVLLVLGAYLWAK